MSLRPSPAARRDRGFVPWLSATLALVGVCVAVLTMAVVGGPRSRAENPLDLGPEEPLPVHSDLHPIQPIRAPQDLDPKRVALGRKLFHDPRLSGSGRMSCATCHDLRQYGVDGLPRSMGAAGELKRNAPTVYNAALQFRQFWDGRARTLEEQVDGPLLNPDEMGANWDLVLDRLRSDDELRGQIEEAFGQVDAQAVRRAIADFERSLLTPDSPFDRFLDGDRGAISDLAKEGYRLFRSYGCASCHQGVAVGGNMFQQFGVMRKPRGEWGTDKGRFHVTGDPDDAFVFKVPSLRNVYETAPYFHDGSVALLPEAVQVMAEAQLGMRLGEQEVRAVVAFLKSLTGVRPR